MTTKSSPLQPRRQQLPPRPPFAALPPRPTVCPRAMGGALLLRRPIVWDPPRPSLQARCRYVAPAASPLPRRLQLLLVTCKLTKRRCRGCCDVNGLCFGRAPRRGHCGCGPSPVDSLRCPRCGLLLTRRRRPHPRCSGCYSHHRRQSPLTKGRVSQPLLPCGDRCRPAAAFEEVGHHCREVGGGGRAILHNQLHPSISLFFTVFCCMFVLVSLWYP